MGWPACLQAYRMEKLEVKPATAWQLFLSGDIHYPSKFCFERFGIYKILVGAYLGFVSVE